MSEARGYTPICFSFLRKGTRAVQGPTAPHAEGVEIRVKGHLRRPISVVPWGPRASLRNPHNCASSLRIVLDGGPKGGSIGEARFRHGAKGFCNDRRQRRRDLTAEPLERRRRRIPRGADRANPVVPRSARGQARLRKGRSEEHTSELQSLRHLVCRL